MIYTFDKSFYENGGEVVDCLSVYDDAQEAAEDLLMSCYEFCDDHVSIVSKLISTIPDYSLEEILKEHSYEVAESKDALFEKLDEDGILRKEEEPSIDTILIDIEDWGMHMPTGAIAYDSGKVVDSAYCDTVEEFREFFEKIKPRLYPIARLSFRVDSGDLCERHDELRQYAMRIRSAYFEILGMLD